MIQTGSIVFICTSCETTASSIAPAAMRLPVRAVRTLPMNMMPSMNSRMDTM